MKNMAVEIAKNQRQPVSSLALIERPEAARSGMQADFFNVKAIHSHEDAP
jgi:hypothetical protein